MSVDSSGNQGDARSWLPSISGDGRFVAFWSEATNLVSGDTNQAEDVFVHDRQTRMTTRVSVDSSGGEGNGNSRNAAISRDGRFVVFSSVATNLVPGDTNGWSDVFVHDRQTGMTTRVSVDSSGAEGNAHSPGPSSISSDGRFVAFSSRASNLVPGDTNGATDTFVHDRQGGATTRVSVDSSGVQGNSTSYLPAISADGRFVGFASFANNLVPGDTNGVYDVFVHDRQSGTTKRVSVSSSGVQGGGDSFYPAISGDGRFLAFESTAVNLVPGDTNSTWDVFVHDCQNGTTMRVSVDSAGVQGNSYSQGASISSDGRLVAFCSHATNLVPSDTNRAWDAFVHDRQNGTTSRVSVDSSGNQGDGDSLWPTITGDGRLLAFYSYAGNLVPGDTNRASDVFVHGVYLTLEATPQTVPSGSTLTLTTWTGQPSGLALLTVVDINGSPSFHKVATGKFDASGLWSLSGQAPPALSGNVITFLSLGIVPPGKAGAANLEVVTFQ